jgi:hypothetical protein
VFPPEPPVAIVVLPERRAAVKGAPQLGAAKRTLDGEHRSGSDKASTCGVGGNTFPLVSFEQLAFCVFEQQADDSPGAYATIDHSDIRGSKPHGHDPSGAASD